MTTSKDDNDGNKARLVGEFHHEKNCRFCLIIPDLTYTDNAIPKEDIARMYTSLTGIEVKELGQLKICFRAEKI